MATKKKQKTTRPSWMKPAVAAVIVLGIVGAITASVLGDDGPAPTCPSMKAADAPAEQQVTLLIDRSGSAGSSARRAQQRDDIRWVVQQAVRDEVGRFSVAYFDGSTASMRWNSCLDNVSLQPEGNNSNVREHNAPGLVNDVVDEIVSGIGTPGGSGTDIVGAIAEASNAADDASGDVHIVALTDGVGTAGCSRVDHLAQRSDRTIASDVDRCTDQFAGQLDGRRVTYIGIGRTSERLTTETTDWLVELNTKSCEATGAECTASTTHGSTL